MTIHHIIADTWSVQVMLRDIIELYRSQLEERTPNLPHIDKQYKHYIDWQTKFLLSSEARSQIEFWKDTLRGTPPFCGILTDRPRPPKQSFRGQRFAFQISADLTERLFELAQANHVTSFVALLSVLLLLFKHYTGRDDIVVGTPVAGRRLREFEDLVGYFVNTVALRTKFDDTLTFPDLLAAVRNTTVKALANQDVPFDQLLDELRPVRTLNHHPVFQVLFSYHRKASTLIFSPEITTYIIPVEGVTSKFDLTFSVEHNEADKLLVSIEYSTDIYEISTIKRFADDFIDLLKAIEEQPSEKLGILMSAIQPVGRRVIVSSTFVDAMVVDALRSWAVRLGLQLIVKPTAYAQVFQQLLATPAEATLDPNQFEVMLIRLEDWGRAFHQARPQTKPNQRRGH